MAATMRSEKDSFNAEEKNHVAEVGPVLSLQDGTIDTSIDPQVETSALRRFDIFLLPQLALITIIGWLDRANIGNAKVFGLPKSLDLKGNQFSNLVTLFYVTYILCDIPWVVAVKKFGANRVLGIALVGWSATTLGTGFVKNYHQALACRLLLGLFEGGLIPSMVLIISTVWKREQQGKRVAVLYGSTAISGAFGGLIAYAIQTMGTRHGLEAWRWLFIIEGAISFVVGGVCLLSIPRRAEKAWFLTEAQAHAMVQKKRRDIAYKGNDEFRWQYVWSAATEPIVYLTAVALFSSSVPLLGFGTFLPSIIKGMGYTSLQANYLTIPAYLLATISVASVASLSDRLNKRALLLACVPVPVLLGYAIILGTPKVGAGYFAMFLCAAGIYPYNCLMLTWISGNLSPDYKRAIGIPLAATIANVAGVLSGQIYPSSDAPRYISGNTVSLGMEFVAWSCVAAIYILLKRRTSKKESALANGVQDNGREGDQSLDFQYCY